MIKDSQNVTFTVMITTFIVGLIFGCLYFATNRRMIIPVEKEVDIIHPFTHCLSVAMSEARQSGHPCTIKEAKSICHKLQESANYKRGIKEDGVKE